MKENDKKALLIGIVAIILFAIIITLIEKNNEDNTSNETIQITDINADFIDINYNIYPIRYDFIEGLLGYKSNIDYRDYSDAWILMIKTNDLENEVGEVYIKKVTAAEISPPEVTGYAGYKLTKDYWNNLVEKLNNSYSIIEGEYTFYFFERELSDYRINQYLSTINLDEIEYPESNYDIYNNGYPLEYMKNYSTAFYNIDLTDEIWSSYNYLQIINLENSSGDKIEITIQNDYIILKDITNNIEYRYYTIEEVNSELSTKGFDKI